MVVALTLATALIWYTRFDDKRVRIRTDAHPATLYSTSTLLLTSVTTLLYLTLQYYVSYSYIFIRDSIPLHLLTRISLRSALSHSHQSCRKIFRPNSLPRFTSHVFFFTLFLLSDKQTWRRARNRKFLRLDENR